VLNNQTKKHNTKVNFRNRKAFPWKAQGNTVAVFPKLKSNVAFAYDTADQYHRLYTSRSLAKSDSLDLKQPTQAKQKRKITYASKRKTDDVLVLY
jgi:hypothetical protein